MEKEVEDLGSVGPLASPSVPSPSLDAGSATPSEVTFSLGAIVQPLRVQLAGLGLDPIEIEHWQGAMEAISRLRFWGILPWSEANKAYDRLSKRILAALKASQTSPASDGEVSKAPQALQTTEHKVPSHPLTSQEGE